MSLQDLGIQFYPAHPSNMTVGRGGTPIRKITVHHMAGTPDTLRYLWGNAGRNGSSHFGVFPNKIEQYVQLGDTAWCNGNWNSNLESITIENWGDWRNGWTSPETLANLKRLLRELRKVYPTAQLTFHQDVSDKVTECPAQLRGHAQRVWDEITNEFAPPITPKPTAIYRQFPVKKVELIRDTNLWDFSFTDWSKAVAVKSFPKGSVIDVTAEATNALGAKYYMTPYSYNGGQVRATNGFNVKDCKDFVDTPAPKPVDPPVTPPPVTPPTPKPPVVDPAKPTSYDVEQDKKIQWLTDIVNKILEFFKGLVK